MRPLPGLHTISEAPASLSPSSTSIPPSPSIEVDAVIPDTEHAHALWRSSSSSAESSGAESAASGGEASESIRQILKSATANSPRRSTAGCLEGSTAAGVGTEASMSVAASSAPHPAWSSRPAKPRQKKEAKAKEMAELREIIAPKQGDGGHHSKDETDPSQTSQASSNEGGRPRRDTSLWVWPDSSPSSSSSSSWPSSWPSSSIGEDNSCVQPRHQTSPVRHTERGTAVAAVQFLELLHALDPSTGNLTTAQLTKGVTPRAARAKPEHLRRWTPARPEALLAPEAAPAEPAAPVESEPKRDHQCRMSGGQHSAHAEEMEKHSAHTTEMLLLHHMRQADNVRQRTMSGELRATWNSPAWSRGPSRSRAKTLDCFQGMIPCSRPVPPAKLDTCEAGFNEEVDQDSANTTDLMMLHHMRQADNVRQRTKSGELRVSWSPWSGEPNTQDPGAVDNDVHAADS
jgi:hypothetical protein